MFRLQNLVAADNLQQYLAEAVLPSMPHGASAPPMPPDGHKAHRNHIPVRPELYRARFVKIVLPRSRGMLSGAASKFAQSLPAKASGEPNVEEATGIALAVSRRGFDIQQNHLQYPSTAQQVSAWVMSLPLQTMARALHIAFPETRGWDVTYAPREDTDIWTTVVWRKVPPPIDLEKSPWIQEDPLKECSMVFVIQPPWILTPQDLKSFMGCTMFPPFRRGRPNRAYTSAERVWAKLWDTCVRHKCPYWVISSYEDWVFGSFSKGYTAGQVFDYKTHDASEPTILECLVYYVANSMGLVNATKLAQYTETTQDQMWDMEIPSPSVIADMHFSDSGSEWDGMDDEPSISAGVSATGTAILSAWGSEIEYCPTPSASSVERFVAWRDDVRDDPPPYERELSPAISETARSDMSIYSAAQRDQDVLPKVISSRVGTRSFGGFLVTVAEQGPVED